jgi:hypothetical protein
MGQETRDDRDFAHAQARLLLTAHALGGLLARGRLNPEEDQSGLSVEQLAVRYAEVTLSVLTPGGKS